MARLVTTCCSSKGTRVQTQHSKSQGQWCDFATPALEEEVVVTEEVSSLKLMGQVNVFKSMSYSVRVSKKKVARTGRDIRAELCPPITVH